LRLLAQAHTLVETQYFAIMKASSHAGIVAGWFTHEAIRERWHFTIVSVRAFAAGPNRAIILCRHLLIVPLGSRRIPSSFPPGKQSDGTGRSPPAPSRSIECLEESQAWRLPGRRSQHSASRRRRRPKRSRSGLRAV